MNTNNTIHSKKSSKKTTKRAGKHNPQLTLKTWRRDKNGMKASPRQLIDVDSILRLTPFARSKYTPTGKRNKQ